MGGRNCIGSRRPGVTPPPAFEFGRNSFTVEIPLRTVANGPGPELFVVRPSSSFEVFGESSMS
jgi:hypothetical protein